jgi:hypothetical protein
VVFALLSSVARRVSSLPLIGIGIRGLEEVAGRVHHEHPAVADGISLVRPPDGRGGAGGGDAADDVVALPVIAWASELAVP